MLRVGLNPYGINCAVGFVGAAASPLGLGGFVSLAEEAGARSLELDLRHLEALADGDASLLGDRLRARDIRPIVSVGPPLDAVGRAVDQAVKIGAQVVRVGLTTVLQGDRAQLGKEWPRQVAHVRRMLTEAAPSAAERGVSLAIEDHQDFGSEELLDFADEAGPNVGVCFDTGNPFAVAEDPISFTKKVAPRVLHLHLKDYWAQPTDEGYRLVRCPIGDGAVPFEEIHRILSEHHTELTASLEPGALEARHIRLLTPEWWQGYLPRSALELAACLRAARRNRLPEDAEWRTPWERLCDHGEVCDYEMTMMRRSIENMRNLGWL
jgi:sugar phosphate isomerase/epimerase